jgi:protein tyrosine phosphatase (PTP) superfamily phosphohydrolase (DUF442 family)
MMKSPFTTAMLLFVSLFLIRGTWSNAEPLPEETTQYQPLPDFVQPIDGRRNAYSASLSRQQVVELAEAGIKIIIRLNGDAQADRGYMSIAEEAELAEQHGMKLYYFNIEGRPYEAGNRIRYLMRNGNTVIHCRHGAHRAPAMAAYYLTKELNVSREEAIQRVGWEQLVADPGKYERYTALIR